MPFGAYTVPLTVVVVPFGHDCCKRHRFVQVAGTPHRFGETPPQVLGRLHPPHCKSPPHPSAIMPQAFGPKVAHVAALHTGAPQTPGTPPPPHEAGGAHVPHDKRPPQPSPAGPQLKP